MKTFLYKVKDSGKTVAVRHIFSENNIIFKEALDEILQPARDAVD
jgi:hypothetical protein